MKRRAALFALLLLTAVTGRADESITPHLSGVSLGWFNGTVFIDAIDPAAESIVVEYKLSSASEFGVLLEAPFYGPMSVYVTSLNQLTSYDFRIKTRAGGVLSDASNVVSGTTARTPRR